MKKSKSKIVVIQDDKHEYTVKAKFKKGRGRQYKLYYSKGEQWVKPDAKIATALDDGNGIDIDGSYYDYADIAQLKILLDAITLDDTTLMSKPTLHIKNKD